MAVHVLITMWSITCALVSASQSSLVRLTARYGGKEIMVCPPPPPIDLWVGEVSSVKCRWIVYGFVEHFMVFFIDCID